MSEKVKIIDGNPTLGKLYYKILNSKNLEDILNSYDPLPKMDQVLHDVIRKEDFSFLSDIEEDFFETVDKNISAIKSDSNFLSSYSKEELRELVGAVIKYINCIIEFFEVSCKLTNKNRSKELVNEISSRLWI